MGIWCGFLIVFIYMWLMAGTYVFSGSGKHMFVELSFYFIWSAKLTFLVTVLEWVIFIVGSKVKTS